MPFGLTNSPATFQRLMEVALSGLQWQTCLIYLDDVITFGKNFGEHLERIKEVLTCISMAGLKLKPSKCHFFQERIILLGHVISKDGVLPDPHNIKNIQDLPMFTP